MCTCCTNSTLFEIQVSQLLCYKHGEVGNTFNSIVIYFCSAKQTITSLTYLLADCSFFDVKYEASSCHESTSENYCHTEKGFL